MAYDEAAFTLANIEGRVLADSAADDVVPRVYATGWAKRGPIGLIGSTKSDALVIVGHMLDDLAAAGNGGRIAPDRDPQSVARLLDERGVTPIDFQGWKKIDAYEREQGARDGRIHKKVVDPEQMRRLALS